MAKKALITLGKTMPFVYCGLLLIEYTESLFSGVLRHFCTIGGIVTLNTPLSCIVACLFEYDILSVIVIFVTSLAIKACKWNLYTTMYLACNLLEKFYFCYEMDICEIYILLTINICVSLFFTIKGIAILTKSLKKHK